MNAVTAISTVISIAAVLCMFFAAPIVAPVVPLLAALLWIIGSFYAFGTVALIITSYTNV